MAENEKKDIDEEVAEEVTEEQSEEKEKRSFGEKVEDTIDDVVANVQDFFYGERNNMNEDIPATMPDPDNEIRHINKVQTRRNFNKKYGFKILKWFFIVGAVLGGFSLLVSLIGLFIS